MGFAEELSNLTNSSLFLLRGLGIKKEDIETLGFINAFLDDRNHEPHYLNAVYVLFKPEEITDFQFFIMKEQDRGANILEDYDYEGGYIVMVYGFPEEYLKEYEFFKKGQYSKFRKKYVDLFPKEVEMKNQYGASLGIKATAYYHIFNRTEDIKKYWEEILEVKLDDSGEYWGIPDMNKETLDINKIKENG